MRPTPRQSARRFAAPPCDLCGRSQPSSRVGYIRARSQNGCTLEAGYMTAPVSFREKVRFFSLAPRAPSIHDPKSGAAFDSFRSGYALALVAHALRPRRQTFAGRSLNGTEYYLQMSLHWGSLEFVDCFHNP